MVESEALIPIMDSESIDLLNLELKSSILYSPLS
jgi:hypothetical protein